MWALWKDPISQSFSSVQPNKGTGIYIFYFLSLFTLPSFFLPTTYTVIVIKTSPTEDIKRTSPTEDIKRLTNPQQYFGITLNIDYMQDLFSSTKLKNLSKENQAAL